MNLAKLAEYIRSHGFHAEIVGAAVSVSIPFINVHTKEKGTDRFEVRTIAEARRVLGY